MRRLSCILLLALTSLAWCQEHVRFIVTGDDRWNTNKPRPGDENGVNVEGFGRVVKALIAEKPDVLILTGDLVGGGKTDAEESSQFDTFFKVVQPVYDAGIKVLAGRGNHEMHAPNGNDVWRKAMSGPHATPDNGPKGEEGMTYAYTLRNVMFISLDQFQSERPTVNTDWLTKLLAKPHPKHIFSFAHKMAFFSGNHDDGMFTEPDNRDTAIKALMAAGERAIFFGHDHLYDHVAAKLPDWKEEMHQFVAGTAGAPFVKGKPLTDSDKEWKLRRIAHVEQKLGYCVVDVDGDKVSIEYKSEASPGVFEVSDMYSYTLN